MFPIPLEQKLWEGWTDARIKIDWIIVQLPFGCPWPFQAFLKKTQQIHKLRSLRPECDQGQFLLKWFQKCNRKTEVTYCPTVLHCSAMQLHCYRQVWKASRQNTKHLQSRTTCYYQFRRKYARNKWHPKKQAFCTFSLTFHSLTSCSWSCSKTMC